MSVSGLFLNEEKQQFQKLAKDFSAAEISSKSEHFDCKPEFPSGIVHKAWELGLVNCQIGDECDGLNLDTLDTCVILEEIAAGCSGIGGAIESSAIAILPLIKYGSHEQKAKFLRPLIESPSVAGFTANFMQMQETGLTFKKQGNEFVLNGNQVELFNGGHALWFMVAAKEGGNKGKTVLFVVPSEASGLQFTSKLELMGRKALMIKNAQFNEVRLSDVHVISAPSLLGIGSAANLIQAAGCTGVAKNALQLSIEYSKQRQTFGRPISQHQAVNFMLADMAREIETARLLIWQSASLLDKEGDSEHLSTKALAARAFAQEMVMKVTTDAVQILGGYGYTREYKVEKLMRDAKIYQVCGTHSLRSKVEIAKQFVLST